MSGPTIHNLADIKVSNITFSDLKVLDNGGKMVYINYDKKPLFFSTPAMHLPFGLSNWENTKFSLQMSAGPEHQQVIDKLKEIEAYVINTAFDKSMLWFKKKFSSPNIVEELFSSCVNYPKDKVTGEINDKYSPTVKLQIAADCEAYLSKNEQVAITAETIPKGSKVMVIARMSAIWFVDKKFGISSKAQQIKVTPPKAIGKPSFVFDEDDKECDEDMAGSGMSGMSAAADGDSD